MYKKIVIHFYQIIIQLLIFVLGYHISNAQIETRVSGKIIEMETGTLVNGAHIYVKNSIINTTTDINGTFKIDFALKLPVVLIIHARGYEDKKINILSSQLDIRIDLKKRLYKIGTENVHTPLKQTQKQTLSPASIETINHTRVDYIPYPNSYESIASLVGVRSIRNSIVIPLFNTRGFSTTVQNRMVQQIDNMDMILPVIGFSPGNFGGLSTLDLDYIEVLSGPSSALYGPNSYNGIISMVSKSPFEHPTISAKVKYGITTSNTREETVSPYYQAAVRYGRVINSNLAVKGVLDFTHYTSDWSANDYTTNRNSPDSEKNTTNSPTFDGINLLGDEKSFIASYSNQQNQLTFVKINRTGIPEKHLIDNNNATNLMGSASLEYKINNLFSTIVEYRLGYGSSIYQGISKFRVKDASIHYLKGELKYKNSYARIYIKQTSTGKSWDLNFLGTLVNERISPSSVWFPKYIFNYKSVLEGLDPTIPALQDLSTITDAKELEKAKLSNQNTILAAHEKARTMADKDRIDYNSPEFAEIVNQLKNKKIDSNNINNTGVGVSDDSRVYHGELYHEFNEEKTNTLIQLGTKLRIYDLHSNGSLYNESKKLNEFERLYNTEYSFFSQLTKNLLYDKITLYGTLGYSKNDNFNGIFSYRLASNFILDNGENHNISFSYQTGFRNPDAQDQYFWLHAGSYVYFGNTESNAASYNLHDGSTYSASTVQKFLLNGGSFDKETGRPINSDTNILLSDKIKLEYLQPEEVQSIEISYKALLNPNLLFNFTYYRNQYNKYIYQRSVYNSNPIIRNNETLRFLDNGVIGQFITFVNAKSIVNSQGYNALIKWKFSRNYELHTHYSYTSYELVKSLLDDNFESQFNTPPHAFLLSITRENILSRFNISGEFKYQSSYFWESSYTKGNVGEFGIFNAVISTRLPKYKSKLKIGATNILGEDYRTLVGGSFIGRQYFISLTFDDLVK